MLNNPGGIRKISWEISKKSNVEISRKYFLGFYWFGEKIP